METSLVFIAGGVLCLIALGITAVGMRNESFPGSPRVVAGVLGLTALIVAITATGAVLSARDEQGKRRGETEELLVEAREEESKRESGTILRELQGEEKAQQLFSDRCGACHVLQAAGTEGQVGPSLDDLDPKAGRVERAIVRGGLDTGRMPERLLRGDDVELVSEYVAAATK